MIDHSRWLEVADADQRELHINVGCALDARWQMCWYPEPFLGVSKIFSSDAI